MFACAQVLLVAGGSACVCAAPHSTLSLLRCAVLILASFVLLACFLQGQGNNGLGNQGQVKRALASCLACFACCALPAAAADIPPTAGQPSLTCPAFFSFRAAGQLRHLQCWTGQQRPGQCWPGRQWPRWGRVGVNFGGGACGWGGSHLDAAAVAAFVGCPASYRRG